MSTTTTDTTTTTTTAKLGGQFIDDFKVWRDKQIPAVTDLTTLTVDAFLKLSTYDTNKVDIIKEKSDSIFVDVVNYYQTDIALKAMGIKKPTLSTEVLAVATGDKVVEFYQKYGKLWLLKALQSNTDTTTYKYKVNISKVNSDMDAITSNTMFASQTMMLNFLALKEKVPGFLPYLVNASTMIPKVKEYLLLQDSINTYVKDAATAQIANKDVATEYDQYRFNELKTKLDLLDPTFELSNTVLSKYNCTLFAFYSNNNIKDSPMTRKIWKANINKELKKIDKDENNEFHTLVNELKASLGGTLVHLTHKLSSAFIKFRNENISGSINPNHVLTMDSVNLIKKDSMNMLKLPDNATFYKFGNALLVSCQIATLAYGFLNYDKLTKFQKGLLYTGAALSVVDISRAIVGKTIFTYMGQCISDFLFSSRGTLAARAIVKALEIIPVIIGKTIVNIAKKLVPVLLIISIGLSVWDAIGAVKEQNWGIFALSVAEIVASVGVGLCIIFASTAWAGPVSLILGGVLIALAFVKVIWSLLTSLVEGDPRLEFINSVESVYRVSEFIDFYYSYTDTNGPIDTEDEKTKFLTVYRWATKKN